MFAYSIQVRTPFISIMILLALLVSSSALAEEMSTTGQGASQEGKGIRIQPMAADGLPVALVYVHLEKSSGSAPEDEKLKAQIVDAFGHPEGGPFRQLVIEMMLKNVRALPSLEAADYGVYQTIPAGKIVVVIFATPRTPKEEIKKETGMLVTRNAGEFPLLYENHRSKLTLILNGGIGIYCDTNPWFGGFGNAFNSRNPLSDKPAGPGTLAWGEGYIEPGIGGITQLGEMPLYAYGAATYLLSGTLGDDIYNDGPRGHGELERLYAGLIYDLPGKGSVVDVSVGKQTYQLRDGFLLSKIPVSTNAGERAALYLGPRLASRNTILGRLKYGDVALDAFQIEPSEIDIVKTDARLVGANLQHKVAKGIDAAFTFFYMADSDTTYPTERKGLTTYNPSLWLMDIGGINGLWFRAEYAYQDNRNFQMNAQAGTAWLGYEANHLPWRPGISYRYSLFTGDDPTTATVERFDPLFSGGLGNYLPGVVFSKVYKNSNLRIQRVKANVFPSETLELILDYFHLAAHRTNNIGGIGPLNTNLPSKNIGDEIDLTSYYYIGRNFFLQGLAAVGIPGDALKQALAGDVRPWYTLQASLYMFY